MTKQYHPDVNPGHSEKYKQINEAYSILSDKIKRKEYDQSRHPSFSAHQRGTSNTYSQDQGQRSHYTYQDFNKNTRYSNYRRGDPFEVLLVVMSDYLTNDLIFRILDIPSIIKWRKKGGKWKKNYVRCLLGEWEIQG